jgi:uncharacterized damage-inducible protein DinB
VAVAEFEADLSQAIADLETARHELMRLVDGLQAGDLDKARRGGWSVRAILLHVIDGERHYARGVCSWRGMPTAGVSAGPRRLLREPEDARFMLLETRAQILTAIEGIDEDAFYRLRPFSNEEGHGQEYSVLSTLQNVANHDREHAEQIRAWLT